MCSICATVRVRRKRSTCSFRLAPPRGTFVFIHGGYWRAFDKSDFQFVAGPMVEQGMAVVLANYDLCPAVSIARIVDQCRRMMVWLAREGPRHGAAADNVVVGGHSAGGHLAAMMFATDWEALGLARDPFVGGVTLSGVHDLKPLVMASMNSDLRLTNAEAARVSPVNHVSLSPAPLLVAVGGAETSEFIRQSQLMWEAWPDNALPAAGPLIIAGKHHFRCCRRLCRSGKRTDARDVGSFRSSVRPGTGAWLGH